MKMKSLEQARDERFDREIDKWISEKISEANLAAPVSSGAKIKLRGVLKKYAKSDTPFKDCVKDNMARLGPGRTEAVCASLKSTIKSSNKNFRKGAMTSEDAVIDGDVLLALNAISEVDLQEIFLEIRALDEHQTVEAVPLLGISGKAELERWGSGVDMVEAQT